MSAASDPARGGPDLRPASVARRVLVGLLVGAVVAAVLVALRGTDAIESLEWRLVDTRTRVYVGTRPADPDIVIASIDDADIETLKQQADILWPWSLDINALAFEWMREAGVRTVVVDVLHFDQGSGPEEKGLPPGTEAEAAEQAAKVADILAATYRRRPGDDASSFVVLGYLLLGEGEEPPPANKVRAPVYVEHLRRLPSLEGVTRLERPSAKLPVVRLLRAAAGVGYVNVLPDADGTMRRAHPLARVQGRPVPSLPLAAALEMQGGGAARGREIRVGDEVQRLGEDGTFFVNFRGGSDTYTRIRPSDMVLAGNALAEWRATGAKGPPPSVGTAVPDAVRGKVVVWGINAAGLKDVVPAPVSPNYPGPEYQATILDNLLHGDGRVLAPASVRALLTVLSALLVGGLGAVMSIGATSLVVLVVLAAGWVPGFLFFRVGTVLDVVSPSLSVLLTAVGVAGVKLMTEGRRNRWLEGTFGKYLSPTVIEALKKDPTLIALGGRRTEVTILFSDVKGFTSISERLKPEDLVRLLNRYLTRQSAEVLAEEGVIDKFIGDAVMAFFGDPIPQPDHALRACRAAVRSVRALADLEPLVKELGLDSLSNRIGVNSGIALLGNMGSEARFDYTAMGDTVNFASRLEAANKAFGTRILIGARTHELAGDALVTKPIARLRVVGKLEPVPVRELLDLRDEASEDLRRHAQAYERAHALVQQDDLEGALRALDEAEALRPKDGACGWLRGLVADLQGGKRPRPWDGTLTLESK